MSQVAVLGGGAFGSALALLCHERGHTVRVWAYEADLPGQVRQDGENRLFLPGIPLPPDLPFGNDLAWALEGAELVLLVVPAQFVRRVSEHAQPLIPQEALVGCCAKGIEDASGRLMSDVLAETLPDSRPRHAFLSGPTFAKELARGLPMDITVASRNIEVAQSVQSILHAPLFRVYTSSDPIGVELAGALKNVIAIASGIADELEMGQSARASLISRGLAELTRFGVAMGARPETFLGLAGVGDLFLTCTGELSRNRTLGRQLAKGRSAKEVLVSQRAIAEGYYTARPAWALAQRLRVDAPIVEQVYHVLYEDRPLSEAVRQLMNRPPKHELTGIV